MVFFWLSRRQALVQRGATLAAVAANNRVKSDEIESPESVDGPWARRHGPRRGTWKEGTAYKTIDARGGGGGIKEYPVNLFSTSATIPRTISFTDSFTDSSLLATLASNAE